MYVVENGMKKTVKDGITAKEYIEEQHPDKRDDAIYIKNKQNKIVKLRPDEKIPPNSEVIPAPGQIGKGSFDRLKRELEILKRAVKTSYYEVVAGTKNIEGKKYGVVIVKNIKLDIEKFDTSRNRLTDLLFLVPDNYPLQPPLGCYMQFPHKTRAEADHHFTMRGYYGAPQLEAEGWYWYCAGIGSNFSTYGNSSMSDVHKIWKPAPDPEKGHNLVTLLNVSIIAINSGDEM